MSHSHRGDCPVLTEETEIRQVQRRCGGGDVGTSGKIINSVCSVYLCVTD